jgi:hypothetical protein
VHPCDTSAPDPFGVQASQLGAATQPIGSTPAGGVTHPGGTVVNAAVASLPGCEGPDFSQRCPLWGGIEYDHGAEYDIGCGSTIAQCGCAMTSAASLLRHYGVDKGPDGSPTTPQTLNDWFKQDTRQTRDGAISQGYVYGAVNWLAVAQYSKLAADKFGTPSVTYNGNLAGDLGALKSELDIDRPVILEQPGHFILATADRSNQVAIADPYYADRTALDTPAYHDTFLSGRLYRAGSDMSAVLVAAPKSVHIAVSDSGGATTGYKAGQQTPVSEVRQSQFALEAAWRDPTCTAAPPLAGQGVAMATLLLPPAAHYGIDVNGSPNGSYSFAIYAYDQAGGLVLQNFEGNLPASGNVHFDLDYNPAPGSPQTITQPPGTPIDTPTPGSGPAVPATSTPVAVPTNPPTAAPARAPTIPAPTTTLAPTQTPTATSTATPSSTPTPQPPTDMFLQRQSGGSTQDCTADTAIIFAAFPRNDSGAVSESTTIDFGVSRGSASPSSVTTSDGRAETSVHPGANPDGDSVVITVTATIRGTAITRTATFTCTTPVIIF